MGQCSRGLGAQLRILQLSFCRQLCPDAVTGHAIPFCSCWELRVWGTAQLCQLSETGYAMELSHDTFQYRGNVQKSYTVFGVPKIILVFVLQNVQLAEHRADGGRGWEEGEGSRSVSSRRCLSPILRGSNNNAQHLISPFVEADDVTLIN